MKKLLNRFDKKIDLIAYALIAILFGYFALFNNTYEYGDSFQYIHQYPMREPVYSLLLQFMQWIAGENYTLPLGYFQNILAIICLSWTYKRISKIYNLNTLFRFGTVCVLLAPHILTPMASVSHLILTNGVMTEGITISMFSVWFTILLGILTDFYDVEKRKLPIILSVLLALILVLTRGQMAVCLILWLIVVVYKSFNKDIVTFIKKAIIYVLIFVAAFVIKSQFTKVYNLLETGYYVDTVSSKPMLLANIVYVCDEDDAKYIKETDLQAAFSTILSNAKKDSLTFDSAQGSIIDYALYHEDCHDVLNFDYIDPEIRKVIYSQKGIDEQTFLALMIEEDSLCGQISKELLPNIAGKYLKNYFYIVSLGFVRTIAVEKFGLSFAAIILYIASIMLTVICFIKDKKNISVISMILVFISICGTVFGTSLMIQCIGRYMIYNFPFFYIINMALLQSLLPNKQEDSL